MKDLLYLKDDQIKEFIQLLYYAYRETFSDPREILSKKFFYFVHSYYVSSEKSFGASYVEVNNEKICSSIQKDNIIATQFHPEKSGKDGLDLLKKIINQYK